MVRSVCVTKRPAEETACTGGNQPSAKCQQEASTETDRWRSPVEKANRKFEAERHKSAKERHRRKKERDHPQPKP